MLAAAMATLEGSGERSFGAELARCSVSEMRLARLLNADQGQLPRQFRSLIHILASRGASDLDWRQPAAFLLALDGDARDRAARRIATDYYRALDDQAA